MTSEGQKKEIRGQMLSISMKM